MYAFPAVVSASSPDDSSKLVNTYSIYNYIVAYMTSESVCLNYLIQMAIVRNNMGSNKDLLFMQLLN